jgi:hypothetical protein
VEARYLYIRCALSIHQKECRKFWGARYLPENTVLLRKLVFRLCRCDSVKCYEFWVNFFTGKIGVKQVVCQEVVDLTELTWCRILTVITGLTYIVIKVCAAFSPVSLNKCVET